LPSKRPPHATKKLIIEAELQRRDHPMAVLTEAVVTQPGLRIEIVKRSDDMKGFVVLPRRWVVERTFSWLGRNRRLAKDYENLVATLATFVTLAAIQLGIRRLARA
jgi:transposase